MRVLVDAQLPPARARRLAAQGHTADHVAVDHSHDPPTARGNRAAPRNDKRATPRAGTAASER